LGDDGSFVYKAYALESAPNMKRLAVYSKKGTDLLFSVYDYLETPPEGLSEQYIMREEDYEKFSSAWVNWLLSDHSSYLPTDQLTIKTTLFFDEENAFGGFQHTIFRPETKDYALRVELPRVFGDFSKDVGRENYGYRWRVYYRVKDSGLGFNMVEAPPYLAKNAGGGTGYYYCLDLISAGMVPKTSKGGSTDYEMVFVITDKEDNLLCWNSDVARWSKPAASLEPTTYDPFFPIWISEVGSEEAKERYPKVTDDTRLEDGGGEDGGGEDFLCLMVEDNKMVRWAALSIRFYRSFPTTERPRLKRLYVREKGSTFYTTIGGEIQYNEMYHVLHISPQNSLEVFHLKEDGGPNSYEMLVMDYNNQWFKLDLTWTDKSEETKEAVLNYNAQNT
ncbi:MAG: hypothetical protein IJY89_01830, partial [Clostridia bacterium]|nr:hypothetical protein [Clostridia bacterium]